MRRLVAALALTAGLAWAPATAGASVDLQTMIDRAPVGATITVPPGEHAGPIVIGRPVRLLGEAGAVIAGAGGGSVVTIDAPRVEVAGLTITGSGRDVVGAPSGVLLGPGADGAYVHDITIRDSYLGVTVRRAAGVRLERLDIEGSGIISGEMHVADSDDRGAGDGEGAQLRGDGIWLYDTQGATVRDSRIATVRDGIYLSYGRDTLIEGVTIDDSRYAIHAMYAGGAEITGCTLRGNLSGVVAMYGGPVLIDGGVITESGSPSTGFGVLVKDAAGVTVRGVTIADNRVGVHIDDAGRTGGVATAIEGTTIAMNQVGAQLTPSADPVFAGNAFIENSIQVALSGTGVTQAVWSGGGGGNHWSDYTGFDADADGVGDLPYAHGGRTGQVLAAEPLLQALASGPAFRLLTAVEDRWVPSDPVVMDRAPSMTGPPAAPVARTSPAVPMWVPGIVLVVGSAAALTRGRRRRAGP